MKLVPCIHIDNEVVDWRSLEQVCALSVSNARLPTLDAYDFMYMMRVRSDAGVDIHLYKHIMTRRYLNLDDQGHAYRYVGPRGDGPDWPCWYESVPSLAAAVRRVLDVPRRRRSVARR